jgi:uncharacterized protein HemX
MSEGSSTSSAPPESELAIHAALPSEPAAPVAEDAKSSAATKVGVAVALLVVMAAGAAAWFTHLIPHP